MPSLRVGRQAVPRPGPVHRGAMHRKPTVHASALIVVAADREETRRAGESERRRPPLAAERARDVLPVNEHGGYMVVDYQGACHVCVRAVVVLERRYLLCAERAAP